MPGMMSSPSFSSSTSTNALRIPALAATPPWKATGRMMFFPLPTLVLKLRARA